MVHHQIILDILLISQQGENVTGAWRTLRSQHGAVTLKRTRMLNSLQRQTYFRSSLLSTRKVKSANPSRQTISVTKKPFVLTLSNQIKGQSKARVTPRDLAGWLVCDFGEFFKYVKIKFHNYNKVSCDVECWLLYVCVHRLYVGLVRCTLLYFENESGTRSKMRTTYRNCSCLL